MLNEVKVIGRTVKDPEKKKAGEGYFLTFTVAVNESYKKGGQWQERTDYFDVEIYSKNPEKLEEKLKKGNLILVSGKLRQDRWEDDHGNKHSRIKIVANRIILLKEVATAKSDEDEAVNL
ncbi:single-stranded DNA-binding protein [Persephonella sp.]